MAQREMVAGDFFKEIGNADVAVTVVDGKPFEIPKQRIERKLKHGLRVEITIDEPIRLKGVRKCFWMGLAAKFGWIA